MKVLVTGGAGFIGSHTVDVLLARGHEVTVLDSLDPQVHRDGKPPAWLAREARLVVGDVRDRDALAPLVTAADAVLHLASAVGVGQSMYEVRRYVDVNCVGTATLLDIIANSRQRPRRLVVASSMTLYGEGAARCAACGLVTCAPRRESQLDARDWEIHCAKCDAPAASVPTREDYPLRPPSIYAVTKRDQEELAFAIGRAFDVPTLALRYFSVFGPRQAPSNPYTGVVAIFAAQMLNGKTPIVYEDGRQTRDFVFVADVARANALAIEAPPEVAGEVMNVGAGTPISLLEVAKTLESVLGVAIKPNVPGEYRRNDVRHCTADTSRIAERLGWRPENSFEQGMRILAPWLASERVQDNVSDADGALRARGLVR